MNTEKRPEQFGHSVLPLLNEFQAADALGLSVHTLRNWRFNNEGPAYVVLGKRSIRYRPEDLEAFKNLNRIVPGEAA